MIKIFPIQLECVLLWVYAVGKGIKNSRPVGRISGFPNVEKSSSCACSIFGDVNVKGLEKEIVDLEKSLNILYKKV